MVTTTMLTPLHLGAFYRPNEDTMFSVGGTVGTGESQLNAGVSIRLGKRSPESRSRVAMGREIAELNARLQDMETNITTCYKS